MRKFVIGLVAGFALGFGGTAAAASLVGGNGYLSGWTVTHDGDEVCYMPYIWTSTREIEC